MLFADNNVGPRQPILTPGLSKAWLSWSGLFRLIELVVRIYYWVTLQVKYYVKATDHSHFVKSGVSGSQTVPGTGSVPLTK
jgi:hypothetical protein